MELSIRLANVLLKFWSIINHYYIHDAHTIRSLEIPWLFIIEIYSSPCCLDLWFHAAKCPRSNAFPIVVKYLHVLPFSIIFFLFGPS